MKSEKKEKKKAGRPSKYDAIGSRLREVEQLAMHGLTDTDLALFFNVSEATINEYKKKYPEFSESLKKGKLIFDLDIEKSFGKRAKGYEYTEVTQEGVKDANGEMKVKFIKSVKKHVPPDTAAAFIWLKNRRGQYWSDRNDNGLTDEEITALKRKAAELMRESV